MSIRIPPDVEQPAAAGPADGALTNAPRRRDTLALYAGAAAVSVAVTYLVWRRTPLLTLAAAAVVVAIIAARPAMIRRVPAEAAGVFGWFAICFTGAGSMLTWAETYKGSLAGAFTVSGVTGLALVGAWGWRTAGLRPRVGDVVARLRSAVAAVDRPGDSWRLSIIGAGIATPLISTYMPIIYDPDSAWLAASTSYVREHGIGLLQHNQEVFLPHLILGPLIDLGGYRAANLFPLGCMALLLAVAAVLAHRLTGHAAASLVAVAGLLAMPEIVNRSERLPMYSLMFVFVYTAGWLLQRAMADEQCPRWYPVVAGMGFVLASEAHGIGQLALALPMLLLILVPTRHAVRMLLITLTSMAVVSIPRIWLNLSIGGLSHFRSNRTDFLVTQGYLTDINRYYNGQAAGASPARYLLVVPTLARNAFGDAGLLIMLPFVALAFRHAGPRSRRFVGAVAGTYVLALAVAGPGTYARYLTPLGLGLVLIAAVGVGRALDADHTARLLATTAVAVLFTLSVVGVRESIHDTASRQHEVGGGPQSILAAVIDDGKVVLGVRAHELLWTDPDIKTEFSRTMSEPDFVTFVTWPSDATVIDLMHRLDAGWIVLQANVAREIAYHDTWIYPTYGKHIRHVRMLVASPSFCHVASVGGYHLYRLGACRPGEPSGPYAPPPGDVPYGEPTPLEPAQIDDPDAPDAVSEPDGGATTPTTPTTSEPAVDAGDGALAP